MSTDHPRGSDSPDPGRPVQLLVGCVRCGRLHEPVHPLDTNALCAACGRERMGLSGAQ